MRVSTLAQNLLVRQQVGQLQGRLHEAQSQVATGKTATSFSGFRADGSRMLSLRNDLQAFTAYSQTIAVTQTRMEVMQSSFGQVRGFAEETSRTALMGLYENEPRLPTLQVLARTNFEAAVGLANRSVDGRPLFGGTKTNISPVDDARRILEGDTTTGRIGLLDQIEARRAADVFNDAPGIVASYDKTVITDGAAGSGTGDVIEFDFSDRSGLAVGDVLEVEIMSTTVSVTITAAHITTPSALATAVATEIATARGGGAPNFGWFTEATAGDVLTITGNATLNQGDSIEETAGGVTPVRIVRENAAGGETGRLTVTHDDATATVTLADTVVDAFGFSIESVASANLTVTDASADADERVLEMTDFDTLQDGEAVVVTLGLPDGNSVSVELTATTDPDDDTPGRFLVDGPAAHTAARFASALTEALRETAESDLKAASVVAAGDMFFDTVPPQLVTTGPDGLPAIEADDQADPAAVWWYRGDVSADPRQGARARVDEGTFVEYGVRADEAAFRDTLKDLALLAAVDYDGEEKAMYESLADTLAQRLSRSAAGMTDVVGEIGLKQELLVSIEERHASVEVLTRNQLHGIESADLYEVSTRLAAYETQLQASYQVTARLQRLSIVNFINF